MISGTVLGFMFVCGGISAWLAGEMADNIDLYPVLLRVAVLPIGAGLFALSLPATR